MSGFQRSHKIGNEACIPSLNNTNHLRLFSDLAFLRLGDLCGKSVTVSFQESITIVIGGVNVVPKTLHLCSPEAKNWAVVTKKLWGLILPEAKGDLQECASWKEET